jgi:hypothetical protein
VIGDPAPESTIMRHLLVALIVLCGAACAHAAPLATSQPVVIDGTIRSVAPTRVVFTTFGGAAQVPPALAKFVAHGHPVAYGNLQRESDVTVTIPSVHGDLSSIHGGFLTIETPSGSVVLPASVFRREDLARTPVWLQLPDHSFVAVPLDSGLALEESGKGQVMANLPAGARVEPVAQALPYEAPANAPGLNLPEVHLHGTVTRKLADGVELMRSGALLLLPSGLTAFRRDGRSVLFRQVQVGDVVDVDVFPTEAVFEQLKGGLLQVATDSGRLVLPVSALPLEYRTHTLIPRSSATFPAKR